MVVSNQILLDKMIDELKKAVANSEDGTMIRQHVHAVRLLCDVILEVPDKKNQQKEWNTMVGEEALIPTKNKDNEIKKVDHGEANGDSIFDF